MNTGTMAELFNEMGLDINAMPINEPIEVDGYAIRAYNPETQQVELRHIKRVCKKDLAEIYTVKTDTDEFKAAGEHKIAVVGDGGEITYQEVKRLVGRPVKVMTENGVLDATVERLNTVDYVLDLEVDGTHNYFSSGILSHNSMYGLDKDTVGGLAWKYAASVRIRMKKGKKIEAKTDIGKQVVGIHGSLVVEKNRIRSPFAEASFDIYFDRGIDPVSGLFDVLVQEGVVTPRKNDKGGITKGWWTYKDDHFQKSSFDRILEKYPELLGGLQTIETPDEVAYVEGDNDDEDAADAVM